MSDKKRQVKVDNRVGIDLQVKWVNFQGEEHELGLQLANSERTEQTFDGHIFRYYSVDDPTLMVKEFTVTGTSSTKLLPCGQIPKPADGAGERGEEFKALVHDQYAPCEPANESHLWSCIRRTPKEEYENRINDGTLWGFKDKAESQQRKIGETFDHGYTGHLSQMVRVANGAGYLKMNFTQKLKDVLLQFYEDRSKDSVGDEGVIGGGYTNNHKIMTKHLNLDKFPRVHQAVIREMKQVLEWWTGQDLKNSGTFGIRIYQRESMLINHVDRADSHLASAVLQVAQDVDQDGGWPLEVVNAEGACSEVFLQAGELVLYEGGIFKHGRPMRFRGNSFGNVFAHFAPLDWHGPGRSPNFESTAQTAIGLTTGRSEL